MFTQTCHSPQLRPSNTNQLAELPTSSKSVVYLRNFNSKHANFNYRQWPRTISMSSISDTKQQISTRGPTISIRPGIGLTRINKDHLLKCISSKAVTMTNQRNLDQDKYSRAIEDLNFLQSNTQVLALAKYKAPETILPLFKRQLNLAGISIEDLAKLNIIHVSGTKGKGSTCAFAESILRATGLKTGFYNSPHLIKVTERIKISGQPIDDSLFGRYFRKVYDRLIDGTSRENITMPSYFSFLTILAFHIFLEEKVEVAIVEVGIGGEYDPTNIIQRPIACIITTLDYDHTNILGHTIESIARNKAGIIKKGAPVFTIQHEQDTASRAIKARADERGAPLYICEPFEDACNIKLGIKGSVQHLNASLACQAASYFLRKIRPEVNQISTCVDEHPHRSCLNYSDLPDSFREGLETCSWMGRCQVIKFPRVTFFLDGAHTRKSMENCLDWFLATSKELDENADKILMVNVIGERDKIEVLRPLTKFQGFKCVMFSTNRTDTASETPKSDKFIMTQGPSNEKSMENAKRNAAIWNSLLKDGGRRASDIQIARHTCDCTRAIDRMSRQNPNRKIHVLATGSLHFVGSVLEVLQTQKELRV